MSTKRGAAVVLAGALCLLIAACGGSSRHAAADSRPCSAGSAGYPVALKNCGMTETFDKAPGRVVVMNGVSVAEVSTLLALGLGDRIVANEQTYGMSEVPAGRRGRHGELLAGAGVSRRPARSSAVSRPTCGGGPRGSDGRGVLCRPGTAASRRPAGRYSWA